ncbi:MAG: DNA polymerase III subunit delta' [Eubacteriales bacterium]|nr:DNA polymerase III subunit delta' [Clostridiales bacterium]MDO4387667.1 DNA polymerase III subunit delta' [Eubacteriales bacterium]MDY2602087.1 DNA polymerase III subunit delta' [Eubacteriales bacterium]
MNTQAFGVKIPDGLMRSVKAGRIAHAFLLSGPHGTGKRTCANYLTQTILCASPQAPCGQCPACKKVLAGLHPDVHVVGEEEKSISVDTIRALRDQLALRPFEADRHIALIPRADRMTAQAQNALLKTLEEPAGGNVFFLLTDQPGAMLPTIVSRCRRLRFSPVSVEACAEILAEKGVEPGRARLAAACAQGAVGRALEIAGDEDYLPLREKALSSLKALSGGKAGVARAISFLGEGKSAAARAPEWLEILEVVARDLMARENGGTPYGDTGDLKLDGRALLLGVMETRKLAASNVSFLAALEKMYLALTGSR